METKIFVIGFPAFDDVAEKIGEALENIFDSKPCTKKAKRTAAPAPRPAPVRREPCGCHAGPRVPNPEWEVCGTPANENLRFGAGFEIDEPRCEDYTSRWKFESDHAAFDKFVEAGEDCVKRGLGKKSDAPITKCQAIRQRPDQKPPRNVELIGETHWFEPVRW
jgi:hypothetical protein